MTATTKIVLGVKDDGTMEAMLPPQKPAQNAKKAKSDGYRDMVIVLTILLGFFTVVSVTFALFHHYQVNVPGPCSFHISTQERPTWSFNIELNPEQDTRIVQVGNVTTLSSRSAKLTAIKIIEEESTICLIRHEENPAKAKVAPGTKMPPAEEIEELMSLQEDEWHMETERQVWGKTDDDPIDLEEYPDWLQTFCPPMSSFRLQGLYVAVADIDLDSDEMPLEGERIKRQASEADNPEYLRQREIDSNVAQGFEGVPKPGNAVPDLVEPETHRPYTNWDCCQTCHRAYLDCAKVCVENGRNTYPWTYGASSCYMECEVVPPCFWFYQFDHNNN